MNWDKDRSELAVMGAKLARLGYKPRHIARNFADQHYFGRSRPKAAAKLAPLIIEAWYKLNGAMTKEQEKSHKMGGILRAEGWRPIFDDEGRCFWWHESNVSVNNGGGGFRNYEEATLVCFNSPVREWVKDGGER